MATAKEKADADAEKQKILELVTKAQVMISVSELIPEDYDLTGDSEALSTVIDIIGNAQVAKKVDEAAKLDTIFDDAKSEAKTIIAEAGEKAKTIIVEAGEEGTKIINAANEKAYEIVSTAKESLKSEVVASEAKDEVEIEVKEKPSLAELTKSSRISFGNAKDKKEIESAVKQLRILEKAAEVESE